MDLEKVKKGEIKNLRKSDLRGADLRGADLRGANLEEADLRGANLREANLRGSNLRGTDLRYADLTEADLRDANLIGADLRDANLRGVYLTGSNLRGANLREANLRGSNLKWANLRGADLKWANLTEADLRGADLRGADLIDIKVDYMTVGYNMSCPEEGEFIGYKNANGCLIKLLILEDSKRSSATTAKCRCDKAKVLYIKDIATGKKINKVESGYDKDFIYEVGEIVKVDDFDEDRWNECSNGIHFFVNKENAINY